MAGPATKSQPSNARGRKDAGRYSQPERVSSVVNVAPHAAASDSHGAARRVDADPAHLRKVDNQPVVTSTQTGTIMPSTAYRYTQAIIVPEVDCAHDISHIRNADDKGW